MKNGLKIALTTALVVAGATAAWAQTVVISPEQETVIHKYITTHEAAPVELPSGFDLAVGAVIPQDVKLHVIESPDLDTKYEYVVVGNRTVLVEPDTRKVIKIIE
ncbi:MAG: DUF1236 domain-containing protein [Rhizobiaceae bacterium]|jgi:hypothetical protein